MTEYVLTAIDTTQIQGYIFGSNRLQENIGGSELVELATHQWVYEALPAAHNVVNVTTGKLDNNRTIDTLDAEVIYAGGGNTVILFKTMDLARAFTGRWTRRVLREAPGLEVVVAHRLFDWQTDSLADVTDMLLRVDLARKKQQRTPSLPLLGLGVTKPCVSTGLVAADIVDGKPVAREIGAKHRAGDRSHERLTTYFPGMLRKGWEIPRDFDELGRIKGEESYIAVVHADGNRIGSRVSEIAQRYHQPAQNRDYIRAIRAFSQALERSARTALNQTVQLLMDAFLADPDIANRHRRKFPLRPIVFGGDDVTFVCHGSYGLALAVKYLEAFEQATQHESAFNGKPATACAGIAIVKTHYPFARAYRLSDQLCRSAKQMLRQERIDGSALDWHIAMSGITGTLEEIRRREYTAGQGKLNMRPLLLRQSTHTWRSWPTFKILLDRFIDENGEWFDRRNKVKALREALRGGQSTVQEFLRTYQLKQLPTAPALNVAGYEKTGWAGDCCVYFDAIEMMDFFVDLQKIVEDSRREQEEDAHAGV
ncbi:Cas10/Cmr2 second palm domain-containing protein [Chloroflexus sp.]|uniref:Cas10/Cmr2 second palm domain-containing protein n=1 Tax=Chloroflexus sp. TaxID=1904827 RepID=UPI00404A5C72